MAEWNVGNAEGLIPLFAGLYLLLMATGVLPRNPKDPEKMAAWRIRYGRWVKILAPFLMVFGVLLLIGLV